MSTAVALALAALVVALAGLLAYVAMYLRRLDADIQKLNRRLAPPLPPPPWPRRAAPPMRAPTVILPKTER